MASGRAIIAKGDLLLLGENVPHRWASELRSSGISLYWHFPASHGFWTLPESRSLSACFAEARRGILYRGATATVAARLLRELESSTAVARLGLFIQILSTLAVAAAGDKEVIASPQLPVEPASRHAAAIDTAVIYLLDRFRERIQLAQLLRLTNMSRATFSRAFKKHVGKPVTDFLQEIRIEAACRELADGNDSVTEIAFRCGFTEMSFFSRVFRRQMKCTPSTYRAVHGRVS